ncbi:FdhF/YdeP family oxidoreductase [Bremerella sp. P1]|uniref:FdhF/YdeP family oxidoreductase n=1 Tax=Bremerella sp. P1 TaxID=3026424 RepID=UPI002367A2AF|nr:FdhF/YdeP family oxidoreductase [Bremerella sp. P1]WDI41415.1 FdhF/YdeP family oxidoreductase [Bremerella sp. P1]
MKKPTSGGGWQAIRYTFQKARESGGYWKFWKAMRSKNACKTCALGMGGQKGGMVNEEGSFPEVCKKSMQAMAADMQGAIPEDFWKTYSIAQLKKFTPYQMEHAGRLTQPMLWEEGTQNYRPISWEDALGRVVNKLKSLAADETFWYFSGRSSMEAGFLLQLFARLYGTNNVNNCSYYCHQASGVGLANTVGSGTATIVLDDVEHADLVFLIGGNPASNHPRLMSTLKQVRRRGGEVIVINPVIETGLVNFRVPSDPISLLFGTKIATLYVQPDIGGDLALLYGIAKRVLELGGQDQEFLDNHCENTAEWIEFLKNLPWEEIEAKSGVGKLKIEDIAQRYIKAKRVIFSWTMGITHHAHGVNNVQAIAGLAAVRGMVGKPGCGLMPIRGHSNVQGIGSVGVTPTLKQAIFDGLEKEYGVQLPTTPGLDTLGCMEDAHSGKLKMGFCLGGNLYGSNPDLAFAAESIQSLDTMVYLSTTLNTGHAHGLAKETIILPVLARDEEPYQSTQESMFNYVRMSDGGPRRLDGPRGEVDVIASIGEGVLEDRTPIDWKSMQDTNKIRAALAKVVPGFEKIAHIDKTKEEFQIDGRTFHTPKFPTPSGRLILHHDEIPELKGTGKNELRLMTVRSEGQFNTVVYEEYDIYRGIDRRDVIVLHPDDCKRLGVAAGQKVIIKSNIGQIDNFVVHEFTDIKPGNALMYYPEANTLVSRTADPKSKTPAFKGVVVTVRPA